MLHIKPPRSDSKRPADRSTRPSTRKATPSKTARKSAPVPMRPKTSNKARVQDSSSQHQEPPSTIRPLKKRQRKLTIPQTSSEGSSSEETDQDSSSSQSSSHNPGQGPTPSYLKRLSERHHEHLLDMLKKSPQQPEPSVGIGAPSMLRSQLPPPSKRPLSRQSMTERPPLSNERQTGMDQSSQASSSRHITPNLDGDHLRTTDGENDEDIAATLLPRPAQHRSLSHSSSESQEAPLAAPSMPIVPFDEAEDLAQHPNPVRLASLLIRSTLLEERVRNALLELLLWNGQFELDASLNEAEEQQFRIPLALSFGSKGLHLMILGFRVAGPAFEVALVRFCDNCF